MNNSCRVKLKYLFYLLGPGMKDRMCIVSGSGLEIGELSSNSSRARYVNFCAISVERNSFLITTKS